MTKYRVNPSSKECHFCQIGAGHAHLDHDQILMESTNYFAIASIGGFIEGWTLICTKRHALNFSADYGKKEFVDFSMKVADMVSAAYGPLAAFEHGMQEHGSLTGCGTNHAHLHLVPFQNSLAQQVQKAVRDLLWIRLAAHEIEQAVDDREYLLMADSPSDLASKSYLSVLNQPESQFFRRILASYLGIDQQANYRDYPFQIKAELTARKIREVIEKQSSAAAA